MAVIFNINAEEQLTELTNQINEVRNSVGSANNLNNVYKALEEKLDKANPAAAGTFSLNLPANVSVGDYSTTEGFASAAGATAAHAEGYKTTITKNGLYAHAEGEETRVTARGAHAEGKTTTASGEGAHAEGISSVAAGLASHVEGSSNTVNAVNSHVEGFENKVTSTDIEAVHVEGKGNVGTASGQHVAGRYCMPDSNMSRITGGGNSAASQKNIETLDWAGNLKIAGMLYINKSGDESGIDAAKSVGVLLDEEEAARVKAVNDLEKSLTSSIDTEIDSRSKGDTALGERIDSLSSTVDSKDSENMKLEGAQTVSGVKTFSAGLVIPTSKPSNAVNGMIWIS